MLSNRSTRPDEIAGSEETGEKTDKMTLWLYPELRRVKDANERNAILSAVRRRWPDLSFLLWIAILLVATVIFLRWYGLAGWGGFVGSMAGGLVLPISYLRRRKCDRVAIRWKLVERGIPICISCGYDTRNLPENRCPECGKEFEPIESKP